MTKQTIDRLFVGLVILFLAGGLATCSTWALGAEPVTKTYHSPYNPAKSYCNIGGKPGNGNILCFNHDACYSDPTFRGTRKPPVTRAWCDRTFCKEADILSCSMVRTFGWTSWNRARANDP